MLNSVLRRCRGLSEGYAVVVIANIARIAMAERGKVDGQVPGVVQVDANNSPGTRTSTVRRGTMDGCIGAVGCLPLPFGDTSVAPATAAVHPPLLMGSC
jgi:hypothetical protein